jgi:O-antigen/teichoic acid export membrane protein
MGFNKFISFNFLNIAIFLLMVVNFIVLVVILKMGLFGALLAFLLSYLLISVMYLVMIFRSKEIQDDHNVKAINKISIATLFSYGKKVFLVPILTLILYRVDSFFLSYYSNMSEVGFYSVALSFAELLLFIPESTGTVLFPKLAYMSDQDAGKRFLFILRMSMMLTLGASVLFFASIRYILPLAYGVMYADSIKLTYLLLPGMISISTYYLFSSYFQAIGRPGIITAVLFVVLAVKIVLCYMLIPTMHSSGGAIASSVSYLVCFLIFLTLFIIQTRFKLKEIFILKASDFNVIKNSFNDMFYFFK